MQAVADEAAVGVLGVEHHRHAVHALRPAFSEQAAGGDFHSTTDAVERDAVARGQRLQAGDARDDVVGEITTARGDGFDDADAAVVQRRVAPDHESRRFAICHLLVNKLLEHRLLVAVEFVDAGAVVSRFALALRLLTFGETRRVAVEKACADLAAQGVELVLSRALVHQEDHVAAAQRLDRLVGDVVRVAGADADQQQGFHGVLQVTDNP